MTQVEVQDSSGASLWKGSVDSTKPLLSQLEAQGVEIPNACRTGMCAACLCQVVQGQEQIVQNLRGEPAFPLGEDELMTCIGGVSETQEKIILQTMS